MFFTQEDYRKIEQWLKRNAVKDTDFIESLPLEGRETITIVQNNHNKKVYIKDFVNYIFNIGVSDFLNVTDKYNSSYISLKEAIQLIPYKARKLGQVITFLNVEGHWEICQFKGALNQWNITSLWENLFSFDKFTVESFLPDEEDLTISEPDANGNSYLSFKDRHYNPDDYSGLGRTILRKNMVVFECSKELLEKNVLTQDMINYENTIYEIRYDFDLDGKTIDIPDNSVLYFNGGTLNNGTINGSNTDIININSFEDAGSASFEGTFRKGLVMYREDTVMWYNGEEWQYFMTGEGGNLPDSISAEASAYDSEVVAAEASVNSDTGVFTFKFGIPKGKDGVSPNAYKNVTAFKSSSDAPSTPVGGSWNLEKDIITYPSGWSADDNLPTPVWMSIGTFSSAAPNKPTWTTPIRITGEDGVDGTDGVSTEFIYKRSAKELSIPADTPPNSPTITDYVPEGWEDHPLGVTDKWIYEYVCTRKKNKDTGLWDNWVGPVIWSKWGANGKDGDGVEYIYQRTLVETSPSTPGTTPSSASPTTNYQDREFIPANASGEEPWTDNPRGVNNNYLCEWVSVRKFDFETQTWGAFSKPALWAKYGQKGDPGTSINILGSYDSLEELNSAKDNGTLKGNNPPQIGDSYLINGDIYIWDGDEFINGGRLKGEPGESVYFHIKYSDDGLTFTSNNGETIGKFIGTRVDSNPIDSMIFSDYTWSQFRGNDGFGYEYIFQRSKTFEAPNVPTENTDTDIAPYGWTDDPTGVDMEYKYEWCCYRQSDENGKWGPWKGKTGGNKAWLFAMYAEGIPGATGKQGPIIYPAGVFDSSVTYTQDIKINDNGEEYVHSTPYVLYNGDFYILQVESFKGSKPTTEDGSWLQMDKFSAVYTEILLANNALVGSAVFNGDYMFSQLGIDKNGSASSNYQYFCDKNSSDPFDENNTFRPNWCVDLRTGEQWMCAGKANVDSEAITYETEDGTTTIREYFSHVTKLSRFSVSKDYISYQTKIPDTEVGGTKTIEPLRITKEGAGALANGTIKWDSDGNVLADFYDDLPQLNTTKHSVTLPKIIKGYNKSVRIPICSISRTAVLNKLIAESSSTKFRLVDELGETYTSTGSISHQQTSTGYGYYDCFGFVDEENDSYWYIKEVISGSSSGGGSSSNIQFVDSLPSSGNPNTLYVLI